MTFIEWVSAVVLTGYFACSTGGGASLTGPSTSPPLPAGSADVAIQDFTYSPATVNIRVGAAVRWTNYGPSPHTTTSNVGAWDSGQLNPASGSGSYGGATQGGTFQLTFTRTGTYGYHCRIHPPSLYPGFTGTVVVTP
jgi:plastocyanin